VHIPLTDPFAERLRVTDEQPGIDSRCNRRQARGKRGRIVANDRVAVRCWDVTVSVPNSLQTAALLKKKQNARTSVDAGRWASFLNLPICQSTNLPIL